MTNIEIESFLEKYKPGSVVNIDFNSRKTITGIFIESTDYSVLKSKNLWRIVNEGSIAEYKLSLDKNLSRIFSGMEIATLQEQ
jgi:hypothetical protein